jgi:hypothetical protein
MTHEEFFYRVRDLAAARLNDQTLAARIGAVKIGYGSGGSEWYGACHYGAWNSSLEFIDIAARNEQSPFQLAATLLHELGHVIAGYRAGHGSAWRGAAKLLGLSRPAAVGWDGREDNLSPDMLAAIVSIGAPVDGKPTFHASASTTPPRP